jgi:hypothetical protein
LPEIWVGGSRRRRCDARESRRRGTCHGSDVAHVRSVKEEHPDLRVIPRTTPDNVDAMLDAGAEGAVVTFPNESAMREFARAHLE